MFFGLRLVFSVALSTPILGSTIIQTGVQVRLRDHWQADACLGCSCWLRMHSCQASSRCLHAGWQDVVAEPE